MIYLYKVLALFVALVTAVFASCELDVVEIAISPGQTKTVKVTSPFYGAEQLECSARVESVNGDAMTVNILTVGANRDDCVADLEISVHAQTAYGTYKVLVGFRANYRKDGEYEDQTGDATVKVRVH